MNNPGIEHAVYPSFHDEFVKKVDKLHEETSFRSGRSSTIPTRMQLLQSSTQIAPCTQAADSRQKQTEQNAESSTSKRQKILGGTFWEQGEAKRLFHPLTSDLDCQATLRRRIKLLQKGQETNGGWQCLVHGRDPDDICTENEKLVLHHKGLLLCRVYQIALEKMNTVTWRYCCNQACCELNAIGIKVATNGQTIES